MKEEVPAIVSTPESSIFPVVAVATQVTADGRGTKIQADASTTVALPDDPVVFNATAPVNALALFNVIVALLALVVKEEVPAIVSTPESSIFPVVAVHIRYHRRVDAP